MEEKSSPIDTGIVIMLYNEESYIEETLNSVLNQNYKGFQCIIINNGSTDNSSKIVEEFILHKPKFKLYSKSNEGPAVGRNYGASLLKKSVKFIHFLDGDDTLAPEFLSKMIGYLKANNKVSLVGCQFNIINSDGKFVKKGHRSRYGLSKFGLPRDLSLEVYKTPFEAFFSSTGQGPFAVFRRECFDKTSGYEPDFWSHEDSDIFCQMALQGEVHYLPYYLYNKRAHETNLTYSSKANYKKFRRKWDNFISDNVVNSKIENGLNYYYGLHKPFRDFKIALKAFQLFLKNKKISTFKFALSLAKSGFVDLFFKRSLKEIRNDRNQKK